MRGIRQHSRTHQRRRRSEGLWSVAFWQFMTFFMLILLIWLNETMDLAALWFGMPPSPPSMFRGCVLTIAVIIVAIVTVGHTYVQQKRIISGLLIVCSGCRKIRVDEKLWEQLDDYITDHSVASISHGLCPHCFEAMQREIGAVGKERKDCITNPQAANRDGSSPPSPPPAGGSHAQER